MSNDDRFGSSNRPQSIEQTVRMRPAKPRTDTTPTIADLLLVDLKNGTASIQSVRPGTTIGPAGTHFRFFDPQLPNAKPAEVRLNEYGVFPDGFVANGNVKTLQVSYRLADSDAWEIYGGSLKGLLKPKEE